MARDFTGELLESLAADLEEMRREWGWLKSIAYGPRSRPSADGVRASRNGHSDPTGNTATDLERCRASARDFEKHLRRATLRYWRDLGPAFAAVHSAYQALDRTYERLPNRLEPQRVTKSELASAQAAQARRRSRGDDFGEG